MKPFKSKHRMPPLGDHHEGLQAARAQTIDSADGPCYSLFMPMHYEPRYAYPLIVWLHGPGDNQQQLIRIMPLLSTRNFVAVAPRGTRSYASDRGAGAGFTWEHNDDGCVEAHRRVLQCVDLARNRCHVSPGGVYLAGFDSGGTMALRLGMEHPATFAGIISLGGSFPSSGSPLRGLGAVRKLPVFLATGQDSEVYPPDRAASDVRLLHAAGVHVTHRRYPCGQCVSPQVLVDMNRWIIDRVHAQRQAEADR